MFAFGSSWPDPNDRTVAATERISASDSFPAHGCIAVPGLPFLIALRIVSSVSVVCTRLSVRSGVDAERNPFPSAPWHITQCCWKTLTPRFLSSAGDKEEDACWRRAGATAFSEGFGFSRTVLAIR